MNQRDFVNKIGCSDAMFSLVLKGKRCFSYTVAKKVAKILRTGVDVWANPDADAEERQEAWKKYRLK